MFLATAFVKYVSVNIIMSLFTSTERTNYLIDLIPKAMKLAALLGTVCGFFYLFAYTRHVGIPFPLQLSVLPLSLLVIGLSAFGSGIILAGGLMVPALMADDPFNAAKDYLLARETNEHRARTRLIRWFQCWMVPMLLTLSSIAVWLSNTKGNSLILIVIGWGLVAAALLWIILTPIFIRPLRIKWKSYIFSTAYQTLLAVFAYSLLIFLLIAIYPEIDEWSAWKGCVFAAAIFGPIYLFVTIPPDGSLVPLVVYPPEYDVSKYKTTTLNARAVGFAIFLALISMFFYPVNAKIGTAVLRIFGLGGGIPIVVCVKDPPNPTVKGVVKLDAENCSERLSLLFEGGDRIYLVAPVAKNAPKKNNDQPFSLRQDDILIKKYPHQ